MKTIGIIMAGVLLLTVAASACSDSDAESGVSAEDLAKVEELAVNAQIATALNTYRIDDMHNLDDDSQKASEFDAGWSGRLARMHQVTLATQWPEELKAMADEFAANLDAAIMALDDEDLAAYKGAVGKAHAAWHDLDPAAWNLISGAEHEDTHHGASATPMEGMGGG